MPTSKILASLLSLPLLLASTGCINPSRTIELYYPPRVPSGQLDLRLPAPQRGERPSVHVHGFEDLRPWTRVGDSRTDWGFHTSVVEASNSVDGWMNAGLSAYLAQQGYASAPKGLADIFIEGKLRELFVAQRFSFEAQLRMLLIARCSCHGKILITKEMDLAASLDGELEHGHAEALANLLEQAGEFLAAELRYLRSDRLHLSPRRRVPKIKSSK